MRKQAAVRLEGGLGDHILGMRLLQFVRRRYPEHLIVVYCDCGGYRSQLEAASMSPFADEIVPVFQDRSKVTAENLGSLDNLQPEYLAKMRQADAFIDAWPGPPFCSESREINPAFLYIPQSVQLGVPYFHILASRPRLKIPRSSEVEAAHWINFSLPGKYIAINFEKLGAEGLRRQFYWLRPFLLRLLEDSSLTLINIFSRRMDFPHYPEDLQLMRRKEAASACEAVSEICTWHSRIIPLVDDVERPLSVQTLAAILAKCHYFLGVDNGLKHLAWALRVPRTPFFPCPPNSYFISRWMPDYHRVVFLDAIEGQWPSLAGAIGDSLVKSPRSAY